MQYLLEGREKENETTGFPLKNARREKNPMNGL